MLLSPKGGVTGELLRFFMSGMLFAEFAILLHLEPFGIVLLIFKSIVISLLAFRTCQSNLISCAFCSHNAPSKHEKLHLESEMLIYFSTLARSCQSFFAYF